MTKAELRLEILKICYRRDQNSLTILEEAKKFEEYVSEPEPNIYEKMYEREPSKAGRTTGKTVPQTQGKKE